MVTDWIAMTERRENGFDDDAGVSGHAELEFVAADVSFEDLYDEQFLVMVRLATLMCGRVEAARDIVQDAFVKLHVKWRSVEYPKAYLRTSVVNGCRSRARWERLRRGKPSVVVPVAEQEAEDLNDVLALLTVRQRAAIVFRFYEQRSEAEIAELLDCRPGTVGSLISRGLATMKQELTIAPDGVAIGSTSLDGKETNR
jgi:RNA polymerase sigma factor (sigma-70 family)